MTQPNHAARSYVRRGAVALALAALSLSGHAVVVSKKHAAQITAIGGNKAQAAWKGYETPAVWRNAQYSATGGKARLTVDAPTPFKAGGSFNQFMAQMRAIAEPAELAKSFATGRGILGGVAIVGTALALVADTACLELAGGTLVEGAAWNECKFTSQNITEYRASNTNGGWLTPGSADWFPSRTQAGEFAFSYMQSAASSCFYGGARQYRNISFDPQLKYEEACRNSSGQYVDWISRTYGYQTRTSSAQVRDGWQPTSTEAAQQKLEDLIEQYCTAGDPKCYQAMESLVDLGAEIEVGTPSVTGPASDAPVTQQSTTQKTVTNPDGSTTTLTITNTTTTTNNYQYDGDTITRTENKTVTTTTTNPTTGETTTETEETTSEPEPVDPCDANPDSLACSKLDNPSVDLPEKEISVSWTPDNLGFGGGSCPPPITFSVATGTYTVPFTSLCDIISGVIRPLLLLMATLGAYFIILPRET